MYFVMDSHSFYNFIYFILLIIVSDFGLSWADQDIFMRVTPDQTQTTLNCLYIYTVVNI